MICTQKMGDNEGLEWMRRDSKFILKQNGSQLIQVEGLDKDVHGIDVNVSPRLFLFQGSRLLGLGPWGDGD